MSRISVSYKHTAVNAYNQVGEIRLGRVQNFEVSSTLPNTPVMELGSDRKVGNIYDIPEVQVTVSAFDVGSRNVFYLAGRDWSSAAQTDNIELQQLGYVCLAQPVKSHTSNDIVGTIVIPHAKLDRVSLNYTTNGDATEDYTFVGADRLLLRYDAFLASGTVTGGTATLSATARQLQNGNYYICAFSSNGYIPDDAITGSTASSISFDSARVPDGTNVFVVIHRDLTNAWQYTYNAVPSSLPIGVRGWGVEVYLYSGSTPRRIYRAQSVSIDASFNSTPVLELGNERRVGYSETVPEVTGTLEVLAHDFAITRRLSGDDAEAQDNWDLTRLSGAGYGLEIRLYERGANRTQPSNRIKTIWIPSIEITGETSTSQVQQDKTIRYEFMSRTSEIYFYRNYRP